MHIFNQKRDALRGAIRRCSTFVRFLAVFACIFLTSCAEVEFGSHVWKNTPDGSKGNFKVGKPYSIEGKTYVPQEEYEFSETGVASWYGPGFHGKRTANGERFDSNELTAAHRTLQMPSLVRVTNLENGRSVVVRVNDRGPFSKGRVMDVSSRAAELLGFKAKGTARIRLDVLADQSRQIAAAAKAGKDVRGTEIALNRQEQDKLALAEGAVSTATIASAAVPVDDVYGAPLSGTTPAVTGPAPAVLASASSDGMDRLPDTARPPPDLSGTGVKGHFKNGVFYPDPDVTQLAVAPTSLYVQAGAFANIENAQRAEQRLAQVGRAFVMPVNSNGRQLYRIRVGPIATVDEADILLNRVVDTGFRDAILVVDQQ